MNNLLENLNVRFIGIKAFLFSKVNNNRGSYGLGAIIFICILIIITLATKAPVETFNSGMVTKLTTWGGNAIDAEIGK
ncbi:MAG: hypothetical protein JXR88_03605 [Clostridia bacterium]|nr:hypothetical protein [Clostridia bacterium]